MIRKFKFSGVVFKVDLSSEVDGEQFRYLVDEITVGEEPEVMVIEDAPVRQAAKDHFTGWRTEELSDEYGDEMVDDEYPEPDGPKNDKIRTTVRHLYGILSSHQEGMEADEGFDGGEFSGPAHFKAEEAEMRKAITDAGYSVDEFVNKLVERVGYWWVYHRLGDLLRLQTEEG